MAAASSARTVWPRPRWGDDATESSGEEYMKDLQPKFKAPKSAHRGGLEERCNAVASEQRGKDARTQKWMDKCASREAIDGDMKFGAPKDHSIYSTSMRMCNAGSISSFSKRSFVMSMATAALSCKHYSIFHVSMTRTLECCIMASSIML